MILVNRVERVLKRGPYPTWLGYFLEKKFFQKCPIHDLQKNECNRYCITCDEPLCKYCIKDGHHNDHKILTIYRHVYQDVVRLDDMENHMNCDKIQPYKCNKKWVVSLNPLPHKGSWSRIEGDGACKFCKRNLTNPQTNRFCSIACKVKIGEEAAEYKGPKVNKNGVRYRALKFKEEMEQSQNAN
ncbi:hypothetical protein CDL12_11881 [Handroanthus impetiginosus]|uniref:B box-type domain-containing protein n=1 Tax=Handroanthus impetiginosus TaxID=429701 RepID=A0A2G9HD54_9LAMI|nr:hypothetical protein CDL12_11881 [Handroanthus impetiginosus]